MAAENVIYVNNLSKFYGKAIGVENLKFSVSSGEIFGFLGPNGAGKTTTIRMLLHLLHASSGEISLFGKPLKKHSIEILERCGYLPGEFAAYNQMTAKEYLRFAELMRRKKAGSQKELLQRFEISAKDLSKKVKQLSHGTMQKLGIIQAFFHKPQLLILDEPTTGLDPLMQAEFYKLINEYNKAGSTIFFSSHNLPEVERICSRVAIIKDGRLVALETLAELKKRRFRRVELTLKKQVKSITIPQAKLIDNQGLQYTFLVKGEIQSLLKNIAQLPIENMVFPEADLEDIFMAYYEGGDND